MSKWYASHRLGKAENADYRSVLNVLAGTALQVTLRLTIAAPMLDIGTEWTPSRRLPKSSALSAFSQRRILDR
jgi:hypothetical protein